MSESNQGNDVNIIVISSPDYLNICLFIVILSKGVSAHKAPHGIAVSELNAKQFGGGR